VVSEVERRERSTIAQLLRLQGLPKAELVALLWQHFKDPSLAASERLFFDVYAKIVTGQLKSKKLSAGFVEPWIAAFAEPADKGRPKRSSARADARLMAAVIRGLLLDLLVTGDREGVDDAMNRFAEWVSVVDGAPRRGEGSGA
jgi:hypothetical protein